MNELIHNDIWLNTTAERMNDDCSHMNVLIIIINEDSFMHDSQLRSPPHTNHSLLCHPLCTLLSKLSAQVAKNCHPTPSLRGEEGRY